MYLNEDDQMTIVEILHEIEHGFYACHYALQGRRTECMMFQRAAANAQRGALELLDKMVEAKVIAIMKGAE